ncbi:Catalase [Tolypocladium paradoxum]|uniref:Catalase n=1 Tax=Tolypocladium paradoxum TaxID=94208 RepID=A0A2S4L308_9HYPO|nr:Catalase [Tolypocladium paradoxum]
MGPFTIGVFDGAGLVACDCQSSVIGSLRDISEPWRYWNDLPVAISTLTIAGHTALKLWELWESGYGAVAPGPDKPKTQSCKHQRTHQGPNISRQWPPEACNGPLLLQDFHLIDLLAHFDRERIPERVVHAKGAGAYGEFVVTHDISELTSINMLSPVGKKTPVAVRFSTDYLTTHHESIHQVMHLFSDRGTPFSYRHMNGYSGHCFKWIKPEYDGSYVYVKIHLKTDQGSKTFTNEKATKMAAEDPDWCTKDLYESIEIGNYPSWTVYVQVLTPGQAEGLKWNIFDLTKVWPHKDVPLKPFGKVTLNKNVENYFAEMEQLAFSPSHLVPGVEPSADPVLQARLFSYPDTQRHRLGANYQQIPVNAPLRVCNPFQRDGAMAVTGNYGAMPNYPSSYEPLAYRSVHVATSHEQWTARVVHDIFGQIKPEDYQQANELWHVLGREPGQQQNFVHNVASHLCAAKREVRFRAYEMFSRANQHLGRLVRDETEKLSK